MNRVHNPILRKSILLCLLVLLALGAAATAVAQGGSPTPEIVQRSLLFHGKGQYDNSVTAMKICSKSGCFRLRSQVDGDLFDHTVTTIPGEGEAERKVRVTNGSVELWLDGEPQEVAKDEEQRLRDFVNARVYFPFLPYRLGDPSVRAAQLDFQKWALRPLYRIKVTFEEGSSSAADDEYMFWFEPRSGRLQQFAYTFNEKKGLRFRRLVNYRREGEILFADQENYGLSGENLSVEAIDEEYVKGMELISTVKLEDIEVHSLESVAP